MTKTIFHCTTNIVLFTLFGLAFLLPLSDVSQGVSGFSGTVTIFPILLFVYLIAYPIIYVIAKKRFKWPKKENSEMAYSDEREKAIVGEATTTAYKVLIGGLIVIVASLGGIRFLSLFTGLDISIYSASIFLLTILLVAASISYCVTWCLEYKK